MDWMGWDTAVSAVASDCKQYSVFDLAWSADGEFGIPSAVVKSEATESGLGGRARASGSVGGDLCGQVPICRRVLSCGELDRGGTNVRLWEIGATLLVAWPTEAGVGLSPASSSAAMVV